LIALNSTQPDIFESIKGLRGDYTRYLLSALKEGLSAISKAKDSGKHIGSYYDYPNLSFNKNGLPSLTSTIGSGPTEYRGCFSSYSGKPLVNENELRSFDDLVKFVRSHEELCKRFTIDINPNATKELNIEFDKVYILSEVKDCIERYIHQFDEFNYAKEKAIAAVTPSISYVFDKNLHIDISVPILFLNFPFDNYQLAERIFVEKISEYEHKARYKVKSYNTSANQHVINSATHALVLKGWTVPNSERMWNFDILSKARAYPIDMINQFFGALRISSTIDTGYSQVYAVAKGWGAHCTANLPYLQGVTVRAYPSWFEDYYWNTEDVPDVTDKEIEHTKVMFNLLSSAKENSINLALKRLNRCLIRDDEEDAVLDATIALEALLSDGNQEMTHKLAMRVGALSQLDDKLPKTPVQAFEDVKSIYGYRSAIVHGSKNLDKKRIIKIAEEKSIGSSTLSYGN